MYHTRRAVRSGALSSTEVCMPCSWPRLNRGDRAARPVVAHEHHPTGESELCVHSTAIADRSTLEARGTNRPGSNSNARSRRKRKIGSAVSLQNNAEAPLPPCFAGNISTIVLLTTLPFRNGHKSFARQVSYRKRWTIALDTGSLQSGPAD